MPRLVLSDIWKLKPKVESWAYLAYLAYLVLWYLSEVRPELSSLLAGHLACGFLALFENLSIGLSSRSDIVKVAVAL